MLTNTSGLAGIAYWINMKFKLEGELAINKHDELCVKLKEEIDTQFANGRQTAMTDKEIFELIEKFAPNRFSK